VRAARAGVSLEALVAAVAVLIAFGGSIIVVSDCVREPRTLMAPERLRYGSARSSGDNLNVRQAAVSGEPRCYMNRSRGDDTRRPCGAAVRD